MKSMKSMKRTKRWVLGSTILAMTLGAALTGCSKTEQGASSSSAPSAASKTEDKYDKLPRSVSVSMYDRGAVAAEEGSYEQNRWTKWIQEQSGVQVKYVPVPRNQAQDKLNTLIASGEAPDLIWDYDRNYIGTLVSQGVVQPIDDYINQYSTVIKNYINENPELKPLMTFDGKIYGITTKRPLNGLANGGMWIRQDWLDKVGMKAPTTEEEFFAVTKAFKEKGLSGNTNAPVVSMFVWPNVIAGLYATHSTQWYLDGGKMMNANLVDRNVGALTFERKLYENGYIDKEYLTDKNSQKMMADWAQGKTGILIGTVGNGIDTYMKDLMKNYPDANPVPLAAFSTKYGKFGAYQETQASIYVAFNKNMKNPKAAIQYLDWMLDKGWYTLLNGTENTHFKLVNGVPQVLDSDKVKKEVAYAGEYAILRNDAKTFKLEDLMIKAAQDPLSQRWAKLNAEAMKTALSVPFRRDIPFSPNSPEISNVLASIAPKLTEIRTRAIIKGDITPEQALDMMRKEYKNAGGDKADQIAQEWYEKNKANFK
ncbi:extracellular solute-binding protein [Paenibacillus alginolyticus]|uniref:extracellular solute-binding protein n=1 Tax=Paenibacillus alginolyticus TaxID=59839 RepID=UPI0003FC1FBC|nr:extracellular solute-binding protein [Paenibacillus alginolyticus]MCY9669694.1 extracellular solute-binding protein [Paenibacillus alginolyticus]